MDQLDAGWMVARACFARVKALVDEARHGVGIRSHAGAGIIVRHVFGNIASELFQGPIANQGFVVFPLNSLPCLSMATGALLLVDFASIELLWCASNRWHDAGSEAHHQER